MHQGWFILPHLEANFFSQILRHFYIDILWWRHIQRERVYFPHSNNTWTSTQQKYKIILGGLPERQESKLGMVMENDGCAFLNRRRDKLERGYTTTFHVQRYHSHFWVQTLLCRTHVRLRKLCRSIEWRTLSYVCKLQNFSLSFCWRGYVSARLNSAWWCRTSCAFLNLETYCFADRG